MTGKLYATDSCSFHASTYFCRTSCAMPSARLVGVILFFGQLAFTAGFLEDDSGTVLREFSNTDGAKLRIQARNLHLLSR